MSKSLSTLSLLTLAACSLLACDEAAHESARSQVERDTSPVASPTEIKAQTERNATFGLDVYRQLGAAAGNIIYSPHSATVALAMTLAGANGDTKTQMSNVMHFPDTAHVTQNAIDLALRARRGDPQNNLPLAINIANSLWGQQGYAFLPTFLDHIALHYGAGVELTDFASNPEAARLAINAWVEAQTNDKIKNLLLPGQITSDTKLTLVNAIHFIGSWASPFTVEATTPKPFTSLDGTINAVATMSGHPDPLPYRNVDGTDVVALPFAGDELAMLVVAPAAGQFAAVEQSLTAAQLNSWADSLSDLAFVELPKFKLEYRALLRPALQNLGMVDAFTANADFSGLDGTRGRVIADVIQQAMIAIDEKGAEAAAATAVIIRDTSVPVAANVAINRPFLFFIRDVQTGAILFSGRVTTL